jgi:hypothetical protein
MEQVEGEISTRKRKGNKSKGKIISANPWKVTKTGEKLSGQSVDVEIRRGKLLGHA